jgi:hypothetical protein
VSTPPPGQFPPLAWEIPARFSVKRRPEPAHQCWEKEGKHLIVVASRVLAHSVSFLLVSPA